MEHWLEHRELSIVGKRTIAQSRHAQTGQRERDERNHPWMVVITLSDEKLNTGKSLGKTLGQEVVSFQRSKAPLAIQNRMHQQIRLCGERGTRSSGTTSATEARVRVRERGTEAKRPRKLWLDTS